MGEGKTNSFIPKENAVYETVFAYLIKDATRKINISNVTKVNWAYEYKPEVKNLTEFVSLNDENFRVPLPLLNNFIQINKTESALNWNPILVSALFDSFDQNEPRTSYYQVSKVAFSNDETKALVNYTHSCTLCGFSSIIYLELVGTRWIIKGARLLWVS